MADERPQQLRLFVACELPDDVRQALGRVQDDLRSALSGGTIRLRWVRPESVHITLKFLGEVEETRVAEITSALAAAVEPFELRLSSSAGLGGFGGARLRVVWLGLEGDVEALAALAGRVEQALTPLGFAAERRPFAAHLTIARVTDRASSEERRQLALLLERHRIPALPPMILTEVRLMRSVLGPGGSAYYRMASFPQQG